MKLTNLNQALTNFRGEELKSITPDAEGNQATEPLTLKTALLNCLGSLKTDSGKDAIHTYKLGCDLFAKDDNFGVNVEDLQLLRKAVEQNGPQYLVVVQGQLLSYLEQVDKS
jgi:hypothetical protein